MAALVPARRARAASVVLEKQLDATRLARSATYRALLTGEMNDELGLARRLGHSVDAAPEASARAKVLRTGDAVQQAAGPIALKILAIDPLSAGAEAGTAALARTLYALDATPVGLRHKDARNEYSRLLFS